MKKISIQQKILSIVLLSTCYFLFSAHIVSAGVIRKPPNNLGLTAYWNFDEGNGTRAGDSSGNGRNGTVSVAQWVTGKKGKALSFNGASASVNTSRAFSQFITASEGTISVWVKPAATGPVASFSYDGTVIALDISQYAGITHATISGLDRLWVYNWDASEDRVGVTYIPGEWIHITWVHSSGTLYAYKNGELVGSTASGNTESLTNFFNVGGQSTQYFNGSIDEMRTYNRALSATEISTLYRAGAAKIGLTNLSPGTLKNGLTGHWTFDGKDMVTNVADVSGNGWNGFLTSFTSTTTTVGKVGQALNFDGTNDNIVTNSLTSNFITATDGTISVWMRPTATAPTIGIMSSIRNGRTAVSSSGLLEFGIHQANVTGLGENKIWLYNEQTANYVGVDYNLNEWIHITWVHSGDVLYAYKNGELVGSVSSGDTQLISNLMIGKNWCCNATTNHWMGDLDDVRTWNRALTASEIKQVHNIGAGQKVSTTKTPVGTLQTGLVGHFTFDGPDVNWGNYTVTDKSGNGITGTISGAPAMSTTSSPVPGKSGQALNFVDTSAQRIELGTSASIQPGTGNFSASVWYKGLKGSTETFVAGGTGCCNYWHVNNGGASFNFFGGGNVTKSYTLPSDNEWHHIVVVLNRGLSPDTLEVYIDGVSQGASTNTLDDENLAMNGGTVIGRPTWLTGNYRRGPIDEVRIYNKALSVNEVKQLYNLGK